MACTLRTPLLTDAFSLLLLTLHACGGSGTATTTVAPATMTGVTTALTSTLKFDPGSPCVASGDAKKCVDFLNQQYLGYDENDDTSPLGVTIRGQPRFSKQGWLFCGGPCFRGQADCYTAGSILNHKVMLTDGKTVAMPMKYPVGIVFQPKAVTEHITKCSWQFDGAAFAHVNGGCGGTPPSTSCDSKDSAFYNICPDTKKPISEDYSCPTVQRLDCTLHPTHYPGTCYWKGPSFYSDATPGYDKHPPNMTTGDAGGIRQMLKQRLHSQVTGETGDGIPLLQYWNEVTMDGKVLSAMLHSSPQAAIAAIVYKKGSKAARGYADSFNNQLKEKWSFTVPIVALDFDKDVTGGEGPFAQAEPANSFTYMTVV